MLSKRCLHPYQNRAVTRFYESDRCLGILPLGAGKTVIGLTVLQELLDKSYIQHALIIAPIRVAQTVWAQEAARWEHLAGLDIAVAIGTPKARIAALERRAAITIINYDNVGWLADHWPGFDAVVMDEITRFKSPSGRRFRAIYKHLKHVPIRYGLTATPASNHLLDIFNVCRVLDDGETLGTSYEKFKRMYFQAIDPMRYIWRPLPDTGERIRNKLAITGLAMRVDRSELPKLDDPTYVYHTAPLPPKAREMYETMEREFVLRAPDGDLISVALNDAVLSNKLRQVCQGFVYNADGGVTQIHHSKMDVLEDIYEEAVGQPLLVFYAFQADAAEIRGRFPDAGFIGPGVSQKSAQEQAQAFNSGELEILIGHPQSIGMGLNLQGACTDVVFYGLDWSEEMHRQAIGRVWRQGQTDPVTVHYIVAGDTIEKRVIQALEFKRKQEDHLIDGVEAL